MVPLKPNELRRPELDTSCKAAVTSMHVKNSDDHKLDDMTDKWAFNLGLASYLNMAKIFLALAGAVAH